MKQKTRIVEFGDFQTPIALARVACALLADQGIQPAALLEPTCGVGNFLFAGLDAFKETKQAIGADINPNYIQHAASKLQLRPDSESVRLMVADFFQTDWATIIAALPQPILVLGNLPWVTNAHLGAMASENLPEKTNFQKHKGFDALTGKANFDISEWMLIQFMEILKERQGALALLCKTAVARKALAYGWRNGIPLGRSSIHRIDADEHFEVAVDAALLVTHFNTHPAAPEAKVFANLKTVDAESVLGFKDGSLVADLSAYQRWKHLAGKEVIAWRSGIKHDCAKVMELVGEGGKYRNGLGELVELEDTHVFPMLKSSHVANAATENRNRFMLVPQRTIGEDTSTLATQAPLTWDYLVAHKDFLDKRSSSVYRNRPPFSVFGIGAYSFAPWKVAISGFYKKLAFTRVGQAKGKPVVLDDTNYFLPCHSKNQADFLVRLLMSAPAQEFFLAFVFWDAKRPITADLLKKLDLRRLSQEIGLKDEFDVFVRRPEKELLLWSFQEINRGEAP